MAGLVLLTPADVKVSWAIMVLQTDIIGWWAAALLRYVGWRVAGVVVETTAQAWRPNIVAGTGCNGQCLRCAHRDFRWRNFSR